jgi:hypothetical protein
MDFWGTKLKDEEFTGKLIGGIIFVVVLIGILFQYNEQKEIEKYKEQATGKVTVFLYEARLDYGIIYEYYVDNKRYTNQIGVSFFKCDNGRKGCIGSEFPVYYSSKNPQYR